MRLFYIISLLIVAAAVLSPFMMLDELPADRYASKIVRYDTYGSAVKSIDPATCGDTTSSSIQGNIYEGLYGYHFLKRPIEVMPLLARQMPEVSRDGRTYRIKLKSGIKYHRNLCFGVDEAGKPATRTVRAEDFVLAFKRIADYYVDTNLAWVFATRIKGLREYRRKTRTYKSGDFSRYDLDVAGLRAIDELTLEIELTERLPQYIYILAMHTYAPIPREAVDYWLASEDDGQGGRRAIPIGKRTTEFRECEQVVGTGPYALKVFERKSKIVLERNDDFRDDFYPDGGAPGDMEAGLLADAGKKVPFIDVLQYDFVPESYSAWMLFLTKQRDASGIPTAVFESVVTPDRELEGKWKKKHIRMETYSSPAIYWIAFNMEDEILGSSKSLRQAICAAFDVESYIKVLHSGRGKRAVNILPSSFKSWREAGQGPYYKLDPDLAQKKLQQAKKELAAKGLLENGQIPTLTIDLGGRDQSTSAQGEFMQQQFAKIGIKLKFNLNDWATLQGKVHNKQCQMYTMGWHADYPDAENFLQLFYSPNIEKQTNNTNYSNRRFDKLYEKIRTMKDRPLRTKLYAEAVNIISEDCPVLLLSEPVSCVLIYDWVKNVKPHPVGYGFTKYRRIDTELRRALGGRDK